VRHWYADNGEKGLRLDYDLDSNSIVFDLGSHEGQWASDIFSKYLCTVYCFEPVSSFVEYSTKRFAKNDKVVIHRFGLSNDNKVIKISHCGTASSIYQGDGIEEADLVKATNFMTQNNISRIDLMKINIEGGEYDLLDHLLDSGFIKKIANLQIQFHDFVPNAKQRKEDIKKRLEKTHLLTYQYEFIWENWRLR
ncbi:MAG TPA: FkbM family methyltransferase, partial [candidate division Zixibacteria bacterium]|nr:FkbM family methyltransferase [candidate division Zixibacteria bacterium]